MRTIFLTTAAVVALGGCNTISGIGQDLQAVGTAMTRASDDAQSGDRRTSTADNDLELCGGSGASRRSDC